MHMHVHHAPCICACAIRMQVEHMEVVIERDGIVSALVIWYDLILDDEIVISTSPFLPEERALCYGQVSA
jgi:hypothetical protein